MSLGSLSFDLFTDKDLNNAFSGTLNITHNSDLSDNPQKFTFWLGSNTASRKLEDKANPGVGNITITPTENLPAWQADTDYAVGDIVVPTTSKDNDRKYRCTKAGKSHASTEPSWTTSTSFTANDGTTSWEYLGVVHQKTELKLATSEAGLSSATAGAALSLGTEIKSGVANAKEIHLSITNAVTELGSNSAQPNLSVDVSEIVETVDT